MLPHWCLWCLAGLAALAQEEVSDDECATKTATGCATSWLQRRAAQRSEERTPFRPSDGEKGSETSSSG
eukprot:g3863.t1